MFNKNWVLGDICGPNTSILVSSGVRGSTIEFIENNCSAVGMWTTGKLSIISTA